MIHVQNCCFANVNLLLFNYSRCCRKRRGLNYLLLWSRNFATMVTWRHTSLYWHWMQNLGRKLRQNSHWKCLKSKTVIWPFYWLQILLQYGRLIKKKLVISCFHCLANETAGKLDSSSRRNVFLKTVLVTERFSKKQLLGIRKSRFERLVLVGFLAPNVYGISSFSAEFLHVISSFVLCHSSILLDNGHQQIVNITRHIAGVAEKKKNILKAKPS